ncbi:hypothetical protein SKAU_G00293890, partial [Synaphobranchus kaupii]
LLIQAGIDINRQTKAGTALHEAALCGKTEAVRLLLDSGINAAVRNTYSQTALDIVHQFTTTQASREIKQLLRDASAALQVRAVKDYCNNYDLTSLNIKAGDIITVLEQHPDGRWKGCIHDNRTGNDRVGYFPSSLVEVISKRAGGDRSSGGSSTSATSVRSSGSGQSTHALHAQAEGVKLLATVLSQSAKAKEHLLEQSKSVEQSTGSSTRIQSSLERASSCPFHEQPFGEAGPVRKGEVPPEGKDPAPIAVTKPGHRKKMTSEINKLSMTEGLPDHKPGSLAEWLSLIGLSQYYQVLVHNGYENIDFITDITWDDLQEIGITKLGHQKKLMMAVKKLAELQKGSEGRVAQRRKPSQASEGPDVPPHDGAETVSPKLSSFQASELSGELQTALCGPAQEGAEPQWGRGPQENSLGKGRDSEEGGGAPRKEARVMRQSSHSQGLQRSNAPPTLSKTHYSAPSGCWQDEALTARDPDRAGPLRSSPPRSRPLTEATPTACHSPPRVRRAPPQAPPRAPPVSVPLLCLPPEGEEPQGDQGTPKKRAHSLVRYAVSDSEQDREEPAEPDAEKQGNGQNRMGRSNSVRGQSEKSGSRAQAIALRQRKKGPPPPPPKRSSSAISSPNLTDQPKEEARDGGGAGGGAGALLEVSYHQQRRASDLGGTVDTGSAGSVRSIAAMLEMSSIGGGVKALTLQKPLAGGGQHYLQASPERARGGVSHGGGKHREGVGLDGEVVNRRRTISGPVSELVAAARRDRVPQDAGSEPPQPPENPPSAEDANSITVKQHPGEGEGVGDGLPDSVYALPQDELSRMDATATFKRRSRYRHQQEGVKFQLTESSTVKRRPKSREKDPEAPQDAQLLAPYQNGTGTGTIKRRPTSEAGGAEQTPPQPQGNGGDGAPRRDSAELGPPGGEATPRKPAKPPVSPKPVLAQHMRKPASALPGFGGPDSLGSEGKRVPPAVSPKPTPPPTAPKPTKVQSVLHPTPPPVKPPRSSISGASIDSSGPTDTAQQKLEETSASLAAALQAVEEKIKQDNSSVAQDKSTVSILDDIGSMFDDLADQLDAMLE